jgi:hypothetical protein
MDMTVGTGYLSHLSQSKAGTKRLRNLQQKSNNFSDTI